MKTAKEQFEERLEELGLTGSWDGTGRVGKETENEIIILIHENDTDEYSEIHYPTFSELLLDGRFENKCLEEFCEWDGYNFLDLYLWLEGKNKKCPLDPADVYFPADHRITFYHNFKDTDELPNIVKNTEVMKKIDDMVKKYVKEPINQYNMKSSILDLLKTFEEKNEETKENMLKLINGLSL